MKTNELKKEWISLTTNLDNIYIYGAKEVAVKLLSLLRDAGRENLFKGFLVSSCKNNPQAINGYPVFEIHSIADKNIHILMSVSEVYHPEAFLSLKEQGFINIIPAHKYYMLETTVSENDALTPLSIINPNISLAPDEQKLQSQIVEHFKRNNFSFDEKLPYQSFERLGIRGTRNTEYRIQKYNLDQYLTKNTVLLDIGCNYGFFDLSICNMVKRIVAVEYSERLIQISKFVKSSLNISNVEFVSGDYKEYYKSVQEDTFDVIFSFAVHVWLDIPPSEYALQLYKMAKHNGYIFFESQTYTTDIKFVEYYNALSDLGLITCEDILHCDDGITERRIIILQKV